MSGVDDLVARLDEQLAEADARQARQFPGGRGGRQPVHTVYVPADAYAVDTVPEWGRRALESLDGHGAGADAFALAAALPPDLAAEVHRRVRDKLAREPIEDLRIDFEDGYGIRTDSVEDADAWQAAAALAVSLAAGTAAPFHGIRPKSLQASTRRRGLRTLDIVVGAMAKAGAIGDGFVVTLPKVTSVEQVKAMALACEWLEAAHGLREGRLRFEIQVEAPQAVIGPDGSALVARMVHAAAGRCTGLHYGTYDYSAACGIAPHHQSMEHPAADFAKAVMQVAVAGTGLSLSDGSTNILPVGDESAVRRGWALHARLVRRSLERGFYQGWDLHPAQLPTRYAATYAFYREGLAEAAMRLRAHLGEGESGFLDEPATVAALAGFVLRGVECGALGDAEVAEQVGAGRSELRRLAQTRMAR